MGAWSILVSDTLLSTPHPRSFTSPHVLCSVAIKSIPKSELFSAEAVQDEIETLRTVRHTNVMELLDVFEDRKNVHIVTPLYEGGELFDAITLRGRYTFSESDAASIVRQILLALECCWDSDIAHRDIKPENILFKKKAAAEGSSGRNNSSDDSSSSSSNSDSSSDSSSGGNSSRRSSGGVAVPDEVADGTFDDLVLVDFGMARKHVPESRPMVAQVGSPSYVAPEVLKGTGYVTAHRFIGCMVHRLCGFIGFIGSSVHRFIGSSVIWFHRFIGSSVHRFTIRVVANAIPSLSNLCL